MWNLGQVSETLHTPISWSKQQSLKVMGAVGFLQPRNYKEMLSPWSTQHQGSHCTWELEGILEHSLPKACFWEARNWMPQQAYIACLKVVQLIHCRAQVLRLLSPRSCHILHHRQKGETGGLFLTCICIARLIFQQTFFWAPILFSSCSDFWDNR